jgi:hypothetical protein
MKKTTDIKCGHDVTKVFDKAGLPYRNGKGSHYVGTLPDGNKVTWYAGELSTGVRSKIVKLLAAAGILGAAVVALVALLVNGL